MEFQVLLGALVCVHVIPKLVETKTWCPMIVISSEPSADKVTHAATTGREFVDVQLEPELVDTATPNPAATNLVPSAEEASASQFALGRLFVLQAAPEFVEVKSALPKLPNENNTTSSRPSADETIDDFAPFGTLRTLFDIHVAPESAEA